MAPPFTQLLWDTAPPVYALKTMNWGIYKKPPVHELEPPEPQRNKREGGCKGNLRKGNLRGMWEGDVRGM